MVDRNRLVQYAYQLLYRQAQGDAAGRAAGYIREYRQFAARQPEQSARLAELQLEVTRRQEQMATLEKEISQQTMNLEASRSAIGYRIEVRRDPRCRPLPPSRTRSGCR